MRGDGITVKSIAVASRRPRPTGVGGSPPPAIAPGNQTFRRKTWPEAAPVLVYRKFSIPKLDDVNPKLDEFRQQDGAAPGRVRPGRQVLPQRRFRFPSSPPHATKNGGPHRHLPTKSRRWARGDRFASLPYLHEGMYGTRFRAVRPYLPARESKALGGGRKPLPGRHAATGFPRRRFCLRHIRGAADAEAPAR